MLYSISIFLAVKMVGDGEAFASLQLIFLHKQIPKLHDCYFLNVDVIS